MKGLYLRTTVIVFMFCILIPVIFSADKTENGENTELKNYMTKEEFMKKYSDLEEYYARWKNYVPERDYPEDPIIDKYLKMEKTGKLPKNIRIYLPDYDALSDYKSIIMMQPKSLEEIYKDIKEYHAYVLSGEYPTLWWQMPVDFAYRISIPKIEYFLWRTKTFGPNDSNYTEPTELYIMAKWLARRKALHPKEYQYFIEKILPHFRGRVLTGTFEPDVLEALFLFGEKEILPVALEVAKKAPITFTTWGGEYISFKRQIRIAYTRLELRETVLKLLTNNERINYITQYDAFVWLEWSGELKQHFDLVFSVLDKEWFGYPHSPEQYLDLLWDYKDKRIRDYFENNLKRKIFSEHRSRMKKYIQDFDNER